MSQLPCGDLWSPPQSLKDRELYALHPKVAPAAHLDPQLIFTLIAYSVARALGPESNACLIPCHPLDGVAGVNNSEEGLPFRLEGKGEGFILSWANEG